MQQLKQKDRRACYGGGSPGVGNGRELLVGFDLYSPALGEYTYRLFVVNYPAVRTRHIDFCERNETAQTTDEFKAHLEWDLRSPRTKQVVEAIMAQATAIGTVEAGRKALRNQGKKKGTSTFLDRGIIRLHERNANLVPCLHVFNRTPLNAIRPEQPLNGTTIMRQSKRKSIPPKFN